MVKKSKVHINACNIFISISVFLKVCGNFSFWVILKKMVMVVTIVEKWELGWEMENFTFYFYFYVPFGVPSQWVCFEEMALHAVFPTTCINSGSSLTRGWCVGLLFLTVFFSFITIH